ncbi:hypothetical protein PRZ48_009276 [Zasmidium cellare]|uniref:Methyltransferase domain-containing protein n=1 Tax=Zasmidium cellare TaxID=395010 RepID=A0ABR0EBB3_ZASCE|nr:hypothetical protein PRZ48_009276 [Zasmidium cellare]
MASSAADNYLLGRDKTEADRLRDQHHITLRNLGYAIHPRIQAQLPPNARVADVATGTGVWALHVAQVLPNTTDIVAFDISPAQFPSTKPHNVTFTVADAKKPFPQVHHGTFDLVHIRALIAAMQTPDWETVMRNVVQLLKPEGFVMWGEGDLSRLRCLRSSEEYVSFSTLPKLLRTFEAAMRARTSDGITRLSEAAEAQLENVEMDVTSTDRLWDTRVPFTRMVVTGMLAWAEHSKAWPPEELEEMRKGVASDLDNGAYIRADVLVLIGQRPQDLV